MLQFEADRRAFNITINSFGTELTKDDRLKVRALSFLLLSADCSSQLYPRCGRLFPEGLGLLADCSDYDEVSRVAEYYAEYRQMFEGVGNGAGEKTLEDKFFEYEVRRSLLVAG